MAVVCPDMRVRVTHHCVRACPEAPHGVLHHSRRNRREMLLLLFPDSHAIREHSRIRGVVAYCGIIHMGGDGSGGEKGVHWEERRHKGVCHGFRRGQSLARVIA